LLQQKNASLSHLKRLLFGPRSDKRREANSFPGTGAEGESDSELGALMNARGLIELIVLNIGHLLQYAARYVQQLIAEFNGEREFRCWLLELIGQSESPEAFQIQRRAAERTYSAPIN